MPRSPCLCWDGCCRPCRFPLRAFCKTSLKRRLPSSKYVLRILLLILLPRANTPQQRRRLLPQTTPDQQHELRSLSFLRLTPRHTRLLSPGPRLGRQSISSWLSFCSCASSLQSCSATDSYKIRGRLMKHA